MLSKTGPNYVFSLPHVHLLWTLTAPQVTFKNNASFVYISNKSHFSFELKKAKYFCMLLAEFHNQVRFVFLGPSYWYFFPLQLTWNDQVRNEEAVSLSVGPQSAQFLRQQICTAINESVHSCWLITLFSSKWKLRTCLNLPVQAVRRAQREARGLGRGWCEGISTKKTKQKSDWVKGEEKKKPKRERAADCNGFKSSLQACVQRTRSTKPFCFPKDRFTVKL